MSAIVQCMQPRIIGLLAVMLLVPGCASYVPTTGAPVVDAQGGYRYVPPAGWYRTAFRDPRGAQYTRDGQTLQTIYTMFETHDSAFALTNKRTSADMLPQEIAEHFVAELKATLANDTLTVTQRQPVLVAGRQGVRLAAQFRSDDGLRYGLVYYLTVTENGLLSVTYRAPALHYFDRHLPAFERSVQTLEWL
ncbi:MAG: hypothetical protein AAFO81_15070 [Pseudomonadota bacterium]